MRVLGSKSGHGTYRKTTVVPDVGPRNVATVAPCEESEFKMSGVARRPMMATSNIPSLPAGGAIVIELVDSLLYDRTSSSGFLGTMMIANRRYPSSS